MIEVDAYLHGLTIWPDAEQNKLACALNEYAFDVYHERLVPYLSD